MWLLFILLSIAGGLMMYLINEQESIFEILDDEYLIKDLSVSIASVALFLFVSYQSTTFIFRLVPLDRAKVSHYFWYFMLQFVISGGVSLLTAISSAALIVYLRSGVWLGDTSYFNVDIYFVLLAVVFVQLVLFLIYFFITLIQWQYPPDSTEDYDEQDDYIRLLEEVAVYKLEMGNKESEQQYLHDLDGIGVDDIAYIYSEHKIRYIQSDTCGKTMFEGCTLSALILLLPPDQFFLASRHLIIARRAVKSANRLPNYHIELELDPPLNLKTRLSEKATKLFKTWY